MFLNNVIYLTKTLLFHTFKNNKKYSANIQKQGPYQQIEVVAEGADNKETTNTASDQRAQRVGKEKRYT